MLLFEGFGSFVVVLEFMKCQMGLNVLCDAIEAKKRYC